MSIYDFALSGMGYLVSGMLFVNLGSITQSDSKLLPLIIAVLLALISTVHLVKTYITKEKPNYPFTHWKKVLLVLLALFVYIVLINFLGLYLCTPFFVLGVMLLLGQRNKKLLVLIPIFTTVAILFLFSFIFAIPVPSGMLFPY